MDITICFTSNVSSHTHLLGVFEFLKAELYLNGILGGCQSSHQLLDVGSHQLLDGHSHQLLDGHSHQLLDGYSHGDSYVIQMDSVKNLPDGVTIAPIRVTSIHIGEHHIIPVEYQTFKWFENDAYTEYEVTFTCSDNTTRTNLLRYSDLLV